MYVSLSLRTHSRPTFKKKRSSSTSSSSSSSSSSSASQTHTDGVNRRKFGKTIAKRQLDVPDYAASFVNYKGLKKLIKSLGTNGAAGGATNKATFFFRLVGSPPSLPGSGREG